MNRLASFAMIVLFVAAPCLAADIYVKGLTYRDARIAKVDETGMTFTIAGGSSISKTHDEILRISIGGSKADELKFDQAEEMLSGGKLNEAVASYSTLLSSADGQISQLAK